MRLEYNQVILQWDSYVTYERDGVLHKKKIAIEKGVWKEDTLLIKREEYQTQEGVLHFRYHLTNSGAEDIKLRDVTLLEIDNPEHLLLGTYDFSTYQCYRQGRHKNDLPGICTLSKLDERFEDACGGVLEAGDGFLGNSNRTIVSDSFTVLLGNQGESLLLGYLTGRNQFVETKIQVTEEGKFEKLTSGCSFSICLVPGRTVTTEWLRVDAKKNVEEKITCFAKDKAKLYHARAGKAAPSVYCTWYYYGLTVSYQDVVENLEEMKKQKLPFDVVQVDEGWEITLGEWETNDKFPKPMKEVAEEIKEAQYIPGIWTSPMIAHETATVVREHPEWMLRDKEGIPVRFPMNDTTYFVFDITNQETHQYFYDLYYKLRNDWGFLYHKLDFTRAAVIYEDAKFFDDTKTLVEAYYEAVAAIRAGMGEDAYFVMCGGLYDPLIGVVDAQRVGSDVLSMWSSNINQGGKTAPYTIKQNILRYYMNAWWNNDPDALMVRKNETMERNLRLTLGLLNEEEVKTSVLNQYLGGGLVCSTEPLTKISRERLYQLKKLIPTTPVTIRPRNLFDESRYPSLVDVVVEKTGAHTVALINWDEEEEKDATITLVESILGDYVKEGERYVVSEYFSGLFKTNVAYGDTIEFGKIKPHGSVLLKVEKQGGNPMVVKTDAHFSFGAEIEQLEIKDSTLFVTLDYQFEEPSSYTVLLPQGYETAKGDDCIQIDVKEKKKYELKFALSIAVSSLV